MDTGSTKAGEGVLVGTGLYWGEVKGEGTGGRGNFD